MQRIERLRRRWLGLSWREGLGIGCTFALFIAFGVAWASNDGPTPVTLRILAGSELRDVIEDEELAGDLREKTGITLDAEYAGTLEGADRIVLAPDEFDVAWFASDAYMKALAAKDGLTFPDTSRSIMSSPVILGVKQAKANELGWTADVKVTWADIVEQVAKDELTFGMTNPAESNSGFSALVGVASAFDPTGEPLLIEDVDVDRLTEFFRGTALPARSSGWLTDAFLDDQESVDGLVNYESELLALQGDPALRGKLTLVYPAEGTVYAHYPVTLLDADRQKQFDDLENWLRDPGTQSKLTERTHRRPAVDSVQPDDAIPDEHPEPFDLPDSLATADELIFSYLDEFRRPARTYYVLDASTSMNDPSPVHGTRIRDLIHAFDDLTGDDSSVTGQFNRFRNNESITIIPFTHAAAETTEQGRFLIEEPTRNPSELDEVSNYVRGLEGKLGDGTAVYDTLITTYERIQRESVDNEGYYTSIVLMTDGESNAGDTLDDFKARYAATNMQSLHVKTFVVKFGDSYESEMREVAELTNGEYFDAGNTSLSDAFQKIRGYQ